MSENNLNEYDAYQDNQDPFESTMKSRTTTSQVEKESNNNVASSHWKRNSVMVGLLFGFLGFGISLWMIQQWDFSLKPYLYVLPVIGLVHWYKKDKDVTVFVGGGYLVGHYLLYWTYVIYIILF